MAVDNNVKVRPLQGKQGQPVNTQVDNLVALLHGPGREFKSSILTASVNFLMSPAAKSFTAELLSPLVQAVADELRAQNKGPVAWRTGANGLGGWTPSPVGPAKPYFKALDSQDVEQLGRASADTLKFLTTPAAKALPRQTVDQLLTAVAEAQFFSTRW